MENNFLKTAVKRIQASAVVVASVAFVTGVAGTGPAGAVPIIGATAQVSTSTVTIGDVTIDFVDGATVVYTIPESLFQSTTRVMLRVDGLYRGEVYDGAAYDTTVSVSGGRATIEKIVGWTPQNVIDVITVPGAPGDPYDPEEAESLGRVYMPGPGLGADIESDHTTLTIVPRGNAEVDRQRENRWFRHFPHDPVARYVEEGEQLIIALPFGSPTLQLTIGQYGAHTGINGGTSTGLAYFGVDAGINAVTAPIDGLVYLWNWSTLPVRASVTGGAAVPTFTLGETSEAEFAAAMAQHTASPLVVVEGERIFAAFQRRLVDSRVARITSARVSYWDDVVAITDAVYGLDVNATGLHRKSKARVYIANPDGGGLFATHDRISFGYNGGARLLDRGIDNQWGLWHEIGHTYQTPQYRWAGLTEVTVNISALAIQAANGWPSRLEDYSSSIAAYLAQPDNEKDFDAIANGWIKLAMFDGLREQFGDGFYPTLNQIYREQVADGGLSLPSNDAKKQHFMVTAGEASGFNLSDYFIDWGMNPSAQTLAALAGYPDPS